MHFWFCDSNKSNCEPIFTGNNWLVNNWLVNIKLAALCIVAVHMINNTTWDHLNTSDWMYLSLNDLCVLIQVNCSPYDGGGVYFTKCLVGGRGERGVEGLIQHTMKNGHSWI